MEKFVTRDNDGIDIDVLNLKEYLLKKEVAKKIYDLDIEDENIVVDWSFDIEMREWGVKGICYYTTRIVYSLTVTIYTDEINDDATEHTIEIDTDKDESWSIEEGEKELTTDCIQPTNVEINFEEKTMYINYN